MITCKECIESMRPDDPRVKSGKYRLSGCDYCDKPGYCRDIEDIKQEIPQEIPWMSHQWDYVRQIKAELVGWRQKHAEALLAIDKLTQRQPKRKSKYS